ncbi:hypothetical protein KUG47_03830 [Falsochrobactrum sp. TDYN1]|uniref:DUF5330 domain-containing protein n=1 Tax=Falsochrobactrum tianjinense TaxID=2706015 RepID=A0A949PMC9_9HYPH|nr:hypothetical protein [Falsochrobactrum sp. TDYN1]MBV2142629.1 hypothetical protein [Falsochrobactrum sp. TDYN1]
MIRFVLKSAFWLSLAFLIMPHFLPAEPESETQQQAAPVEGKTERDQIGDLLASGKTAVEIGKLCIDNPPLCEGGQSFLASTGRQLLANSGAMLDYLSSHFSSTQKQTALPAPTKREFIPIPTPRESALHQIRAQR